MCGRLIAARCPIFAGPVDQVSGRLFGQALPPHVAVIGEGAVGVDAVGIKRADGVGVGGHARAGQDAEEAGLRVDRMELAVSPKLHPADIVADCLDLPAGDRRLQHGEVGLATCRGEGPGHVLDATVGRGDLDDEHVLGQPAFVAGDDRGDSERVALLAEEGVAAVPGAVGPDLTRLGEVDDVFPVRVAGPGHVGCTSREWRPDGMDRRNEVAGPYDLGQGGLAHAGHDPHVDHDVGRIRDLDAKPADRRANGSHRERDDVHRATAHRAREQALQRLAHLARVLPVVGRAGILFLRRADEGPVLNAGNVGWVGSGQETVRFELRVQADERARVDEELGQPIVLSLRSVTPVDGVRFRQGRNVVHPANHRMLRSQILRSPFDSCSDSCHDLSSIHHGT